MNCPKCNGTGKLPFYSNGKVRNDVIVYCDCREEEHYTPLKDDMIDFACSEDYRAFYHYQTTGELPRELVKPVEAKRIPQVVPNSELENIKGSIKYLQAKVMERKKRVSVDPF